MITYNSSSLALGQQKTREPCHAITWKVGRHIITTKRSKVLDRKELYI